MGVWYDSRRNGTIPEYIEICKEDRVPICFKGVRRFRQLVGLGLVVADITSLRLMTGGDEGYMVVERDGGFMLEGMDMSHHAGQPGVHKPEKILTRAAPYFEISGLKRPGLE